MKTVESLAKSFASWAWGKKIPNEVLELEKFFIRWAYETGQIQDYGKQFLPKNILQYPISSNDLMPIDNRKEAEQEYLAMFNRIKKAMCEKRGKKFSPARTVSKPNQLHARLKDYTMDEIGKAMYNAFNDQYHIETNWRFITTEFLTRADKLEKFLNQ